MTPAEFEALAAHPNSERQRKPKEWVEYHLAAMSDPEDLARKWTAYQLEVFVRVQRIFEQHPDIGAEVSDPDDRYNWAASIAKAELEALGASSPVRRPRLPTFVFDHQGDTKTNRSPIPTSPRSAAAGPIPAPGSEADAAVLSHINDALTRVSRLSDLVFSAPVPSPRAVYRALT